MKAKKKSTKKQKARDPSASTSLGRLKGEVQKLAGQVVDLFSANPKDIVTAIEADHKSLRSYLDILKDTDADLRKRRAAYKAFSALLKSHSIAEEKAVYVPAMKLTGRQMHIKVAEGYVEHQLADDLMHRMETTKDALAWSAHANVLSENMEHHLKEEERDLLPKIRKTASAKMNGEMLAEFIQLRKKTQKRTSSRNAGVLEYVED